LRGRCAPSRADLLALACPEGATQVLTRYLPAAHSPATAAWPGGRSPSVAARLHAWLRLRGRRVGRCSPGGWWACGFAEISVKGERELHGCVRFVRVTGRQIGRTQRSSRFW
jgi:hypothetical protein